MSLRWYQEEAIQSAFDYFAANKVGNPIIALPTGTGKSHVISGFQQRVVQTWPGQRFINLTHVQELVEQNAKKMLQGWPDAPMGINSAGLKRRDVDEAIIYAGIASIAKNPAALGWRDIAIVDECHLISENGEAQYNKTINVLKTINPKLRVIGLTATKWRRGQGLLTEGDGLFTDICYDMTDVKGFNRLLAEGYLAPLYPRATAAKLDVTGVGVSKGDFKQKALQAAVDNREVTYQALLELCEAGWDRKSWLIFAAGIEHAEHIAEMLCGLGIPTAAIHNKLTNTQRKQRLSAFKRGELRCLVNNNVLTTGFDHPPIDLIGMFRPTVSAGLWVQMLGRGTRPWAGGYIDVDGFNIPWGPKTNCLVLDFAGNTKRLGPINDPTIPRRKQKGLGDAPVKVCDGCGTYNHASATQCFCCGMEFPRQEKLTTTAANDALLRDESPQVEMFNVDSVMYTRHTKKSNGSASLRCDYYVGIMKYTEYLHFEHKGYMKHKANEWWQMRHQSEPPESVEDALLFVSQLRAPKRIRVWVNKQYPEILSYEY